jgi:peptide/nickel transport system ATP-binding protein
MLAINHLNINIRRNGSVIHILRDLNMHLSLNDTYVLMGESGCGKSMLALAILGLLPSNAEVDGEIIFNEKNILDKKVIYSLRGRSISICWSNPDKHFNPLKKVGSQIQDVYSLHQKCTKHEAKTRTMNLLEKLNFDNPEVIFHLYPHQLSGGMNQRAMVAVSIINNPDLLILDEPTRGLDEDNIRNFTKLIKQIEVPVKIIITHDPFMLSVFNDKVGVMKDGKIIYESAVSEIHNDCADPYLKYFLKPDNSL